MDLATIKHKMTLSTTDFNLIGDVKVRQADDETQVFEATILEHGLLKPFEGLRPFFCLMAREITGQGVSEEPVEVYDAATGFLSYTLSANAMQMVGRNEAYFSFRKETSSGRWIEQFSTRSFFYTVERSIYTQPFKDSGYWFTFNELYQKFIDYQESGKISWEDFVADSKEIIESIDPNGTLFTKLQENKENIDSRGINVLLLGLKNDGTTDNSSLLNSVLNAITDGTKLFFPKGDYLFSSNISLNKQVHFEGIKPKYEGGDLSEGTVIRGGGLYFVTGSRYSTVKNIGVVNLEKPNGFDIRGNTGDITLDNCLSIGRDHCYLIESYLGEVTNVKVTSCESFDGIHGFISKAKATNFINCQANNNTSWGFGVISDNIQGAANVGAAINNKVSDCRAIKCGTGFSQYKRDYFGDGSTFGCVGNQFSNCSAIDCTTPLSLGDAVGSTGGGAYTSYPVVDTTITNFAERGSINPARAYQTVNLNISGLALSMNMTLNRSDLNTNPVASSVTGGKIGQLLDLIVLDSSTTPSLAFGKYFRTNNTSARGITGFTGAKDGEVYDITIWDEFTSILNTANSILLLGPTLAGRGSSIRIKYQDGMFFEVSRSEPATKSLNIKYADASTIDAANYEFFDIYGSGTATNKIKFNTPARGNSVITILIRSSSGTFNFGGFDTTQFVIPDSLPTSVPWGTGLMTQWAYLAAISKYVLVSRNDTKYA